MARRLDAAAAGFDRDFTAFVAARRTREEDVDAEVAAIIAAVRDRGDAALIDYTARFDRLDLTPQTIRLSAEEIAAEAARCPTETRDALETAAGRIEAYHRRQLPEALDYSDADGVRAGHRSRRPASTFPAARRPTPAPS